MAVDAAGDAAAAAADGRDAREGPSAVLKAASRATLDFVGPRIVVFCRLYGNTGGPPSANRLRLAQACNRAICQVTTSFESAIEVLNMLYSAAVLSGGAGRLGSASAAQSVGRCSERNSAQSSRMN